MNYTFIRSLDPKGFFPSFKTLDLVADQSSAANLQNFKNQKLVADFFGGPPQINRGI
jgi:hypothetical protein